MEERQGQRHGRRWLVIVLCLCFLGHSQGKMKPLVTWLTPCIANSTLCLNDLLTGMNFAYGALTSTFVKQNSSMLNVVCQAGCLPSLQTGFVASVNYWTRTGNTQSCGAPTDPAVLPALAQATSNFVCWPSDDGAGLCITRVSQALQAAGVYDSIKVMSPTFKFQGSTLDATCNALRPQSCCLRTWALLMAAYAQQLCMPTLANEFISLPGRCSTDLPVSPSCSATWEAAIMPLTRPRTDCTLWNSAGDGGSSIWTGSGCSRSQLQPQSCPTNACDLWCGIVGFWNTAQNTAGTANDSANDNGISSGVIIFIAVFSGVVVLVSIIAAIILCQMARQERHRQLRTRRPYTSGDYGVTTTSIKSARESLPSLGPRVSMVSAATTSGAPRQTYLHSSSDETRRERTSTVSHRDRLVEFAMLPPTASMAGRSSVGSMTGHLSLGGFQLDSMTGMGTSQGRPSSVGRPSGVGRSSLAGRSSLTIRSLKEELDVVGPLPVTVPTYTSSSGRITEPLQYNVLYGGVLPGSDHSGSTSAATTPPHASTSSMPVHGLSMMSGIGMSPPTTPPQRKSQSFSFGVDTSPIQSVHTAVAGGEWRTAVGLAAATGSARQALNEFPLPRPRVRSASGHAATTADALLPPRGAFLATGTRAAAAAAAATAASAASASPTSASPAGRWEHGSTGSGSRYRTPLATATALTPTAATESSFHDALSRQRSNVSDGKDSSGWYSVGGHSISARISGAGTPGGGNTPGWATPGGAGTPTGLNTPAGPGSQMDSGSFVLGRPPRAP